MHSPSPDHSKEDHQRAAEHVDAEEGSPSSTWLQRTRSALRKAVLAAIIGDVGITGGTAVMKAYPQLAQEAQMKVSESRERKLREEFLVEVEKVLDEVLVESKDINPKDFTKSMRKYVIHNFHRGYFTNYYVTRTNPLFPTHDPRSALQSFKDKQSSLQWVRNELKNLMPQEVKITINRFKNYGELDYTVLNNDGTEVPYDPLQASGKYK